MIGHVTSWPRRLLGMPRKIKTRKVKDIRRYIELNIKEVDDISASRIYEIMIGKKDSNIRLIT